MSEFMTHAVVGTDGSVTVPGLPFPAGEPVEVTVTPTPPSPPPAAVPLAGSVLRYDDPTGPVAADDWETAQ